MDEAKTALREAIERLLEKREPGKTICPSEAARIAFPDEWREHMEATREVAIALANSGSLEICQGGETVDPGDFSGPIRLRKPP